MKKIFIALLMLILKQSTYAQQMIYETLPDPKQGSSNMLVGQLQFDNIAEDPTCAWFKTNTKAYNADSNICKAINKAMAGYSLVIFGGTWCEDTQILLPQLYATLLKCKYPISTIQLYGVNRKKEALNIEHLLYKIEKVPTIIIINNHKEVGRIVETVEDSIESTLLRIMQKDISLKNTEK